ncbi:MAG: hypothetical protein WKG07_00820 [Hymenobacter sp.]
MKYLLCLLSLLSLLCLALPTPAAAQTAPCAQPDPNFHLYLLMGQSNMAGRGPHA